MVYKQRQHVEPAKLLEAVNEIAEIAAANDINVALAGGFAMQVYGSDRFTNDIDVVTDDEEPFDLPETGRLSFGGEQVTAPNGVPVDIIRRDDDYADLYDEALENALEVEGIPMLVITPEYLLAMKMAAHRDKDELDMKYLIGFQDINLKKARAIVKKHLGNYAAEDLDRVIEEVEWRQTHRR